MTGISDPFTAPVDDRAPLVPVLNAALDLRSIHDIVGTWESGPWLAKPFQSWILQHPSPWRFRGIVRERLRGPRRFPGRERRDRGGYRILRGFRLSARKCRGSLYHDR